MDWIPDITAVVKILGVGCCAVGLFLCFKLATVKAESICRDRMVRLGVVTVSAAMFYKLMALTAFVVIPATSVGLANYHAFEGVKKTDSCYQCHVMHPMVNDMRDPESDTLAARHFPNNWIGKNECYTCHTDYGLAGSLKAKMDGYRHLARYTTGTYTEPIKFRGVYSNQNCLQCHAETEKFANVNSHMTVSEQLSESSMSCLNCHGQAHPTRSQRTPGHPDYQRLIDFIKKQEQSDQ